MYDLKGNIAVVWLEKPIYKHPAYPVHGTGTATCGAGGHVRGPHSAGFGTCRLQNRRDLPLCSYAPDRNMEKHRIL